MRELAGESCETFVVGQCKFKKGSISGSKAVRNRICLAEMVEALCVRYTNFSLCGLKLNPFVQWLSSSAIPMRYLSTVEQFRTACLKVRKRRP